MQEDFLISSLVRKYRINKKRILELVKLLNGEIQIDYISINTEKSSIFLELLNQSLKASILCQDANNFDAKKLYYDGLLKYKQAAVIYQKLNDLQGLSVCYSNIGLILETLKDFSKALMNFEKALRITKELGDQLGTALQLENIGRIYKKKLEYSNALRFFKESLYILSQIKLEKSLLYVKKGVESHIKKLEKCFHQ